MTNDERATIYGKAMLELRDCKSTIAILESYFSEYAHQLQEASGLARRFASNPLETATDQLTLSEHVKRGNLRLTRADFADKVDELLTATRRMHEIQKQVERF